MSRQTGEGASGQPTVQPEGTTNKWNKSCDWELGVWAGRPSVATLDHAWPPTPTDSVGTLERPLHGEGL